MTPRCESNVVWELATALMLATSPATPVGVAAREAHLAALEAEAACTCAAHAARDGSERASRRAA